MANDRKGLWSGPAQETAGATRPPAREEVARVAYELYERRGRQNGRDQEDWFKAEEMVRQRSRQARRAVR